MKNKKRFLIRIETHWCGEDRIYRDEAEFDSDLYTKAECLAYNNFIDFGGPEGVLEDMFGFLDDNKEEYESWEIEAAEDVHGEYYSYTIEEFEGEDEEWEWYEWM